MAEVQRHSGPPLWAEVVGFRDDFTVLYPLHDAHGVRRGGRVRRSARRTGSALAAGCSAEWSTPKHGRSTAGRSRRWAQRTSSVRSPPQPCARPRITEPLATGVRAIDGLLTCGKGQRMGVFSGSGVGKSVLLGMMARHTAADVIVLALIGERGREVNEFIERELGARRGWPRAWSWSPPATNRRWCGPRPP